MERQVSIVSRNRHASAAPLLGGLLLGIIVVSGLGSLARAAPVTTEVPHSNQTTATFYPVADAYVSQVAPDYNYGVGIPYLDVQNLDTAEFPDDRRSYVGFNLSSIPGNAVISSAVFKANMYQAGGASTVYVQLRRVTSSWTHNTVTWNSRPKSASYAGLNVGTTPRVIGWDVTSLVRTYWVNRGFGSGQNYGLELRGPESGAYYLRRFYSGNAASNWPYLLVTYEVPTPTPTKTPTRTKTPTPTRTPTPTCPDGYEPNDNGAQAWLLSPGIIASYICCGRYDVDYFKFSADVGELIQLALYSLPANYDLCLYDAQAQLVRCSENGGEVMESIEEIATSKGEYYALIYGVQGACSSTDGYKFSVQITLPTSTPTRTATITPTPTSTPTPTPTITLMPTPTPTITPSPTPTPTVTPMTSAVRGSVLLERRASNAGTEACLDGRCVLTLEDGEYGFDSLSPGDHIIAARRMSYLRSQRLVHLPVGLFDVVGVTLLGGDIDQDDRIDLRDGILIGQAWRSTPMDGEWDGRCDVTDDGVIDILDMVAVQFNWEQEAPGPWAGAVAEGGRKTSSARVPARRVASRGQIMLEPELLRSGGASQRADLDVRVQDVIDLYGAWLQITFDPRAIQVRDADPRGSAPGIQLRPGDFLDTVNQFVLVNEVDNAAGTAEFAATQLRPATARSGSGVLVTLLLETLAEGSSTVRVTRAELLDDSHPDPLKLPVGTRGAEVVVH